MLRIEVLVVGLLLGAGEGFQSFSASQLFATQPRRALNFVPVADVCVSPPAVGQHNNKYSEVLSSRPASLSSISETSQLEEEQDEDGYDDELNSNSKEPPVMESAVSKLRRLKDFMWVRETLEDLTAAEFACSVEANLDRGKNKRAVDYGKLLGQVNRRIKDLGCEANLGRNPQDDDDSLDPSCILMPGVGMGSLVYTQKQRADLLERTLRARHMLLQAMRDHQVEVVDDLHFTISLPDFSMTGASGGSATSSSSSTKDDEDVHKKGPKLYVRDDGTVDWDGALQDQAALRKFGSAVWARINGRDPETIENGDDSESDSASLSSSNGNLLQQHAPAAKQVTVKIVETPQIIQARRRLHEMQRDLAETEAKHTALLNSALKAGQAVANVRLASLEPDLRNEIRLSASALELLQEKVSYQTLIYELERIYTYLVGELANPAIKGYIPLQDRLNVAEFGLLATQIDSFNRQLEAGETLDADVLLVVMEQTNDFKRRLGIDYYVTGLSLDSEGIKRWLGELLVKIRKGLAFYVKGVQLFGSDIVYCVRLVNRAATGYTLKPREVRTLRRTFKDIITFIPVVIILIIPLSPVGHVLVFGAIQRFFPDFFPSCFTEQRQNLLELYESAEYSEFTINENLQEKIARITEALLFTIATTSKSAYNSLSNAIRGDKDSKEQ